MLLKHVDRWVCISGYIQILVSEALNMPVVRIVHARYQQNVCFRN